MDSRREAHDARGLLTGQQRPVGDTTSITYDAHGLFRVSLVDALGETRFQFDRAVGQPGSIVYGDGSVARFQYDAQGRVLAALLPGDDPARPPREHVFDDATVPNLPASPASSKAVA